jgi:hypothetical protein
MTPKRVNDPSVDRRFLEMPIDLAQRLDKAAAQRTLGWRAIVIEATSRFLDQLEAAQPFPPRRVPSAEERQAELDAAVLDDAREAHANEPVPDPRAEREPDDEDMPF